MALAPLTGKGLVTFRTKGQPLPCGKTRLYIRTKESSLSLGAMSHTDCCGSPAVPVRGSPHGSAPVAAAEGTQPRLPGLQHPPHPSCHLRLPGLGTGHCLLTLAPSAPRTPRRKSWQTHETCRVTLCSRSITAPHQSSPEATAEGF